MNAARGRPVHPDVLTPAEWRVADGIRHGLTNRTIATGLGVTPEAVKFHVSNILAKLALPDRRALQRWPGVRIDSTLGDDIMVQAPQLGAIGQVSRTVSDVAAATRWYRDTLGLTHLYTFGELAFFDCAGTRLFLSQGDPTRNSILYFRTTDIRATHRDLEARGARIVAAPHVIHRHADGSEEWMSFFEDPDGQPLAIMQVAPASGDQPSS